MNKAIHSTTFDVTDALHEHINTNISKIEQHNDKTTHIDVFLKKDNLKFIAEFKLLVPHTNGVLVSSSSEDMYHAITEATNKVLIKLKKLKEKSKSKLHQKILVAEE